MAAVLLLAGVGTAVEQTITDQSEWEHGDLVNTTAAGGALVIEDGDFTEQVDTNETVDLQNDEEYTVAVAGDGDFEQLADVSCWNTTERNETLDCAIADAAAGTIETDDGFVDGEDEFIEYTYERSYTALHPTGGYTSHWLDFSEPVEFDAFTAAVETPNTTDIDWRFRSSDDGTDSGATTWYDTITDVDTNQYLQVTATLTADNDTTPTAYNYTVEASTTDGPEIVITDAPEDGDEEAEIGGDIQIDGVPPGKERADMEYRHNGGPWTPVCSNCKSFDFSVDSMPGDNTVELRAEDDWGRVGTADVTWNYADGSEINFTAAVDKSFRGSAIPINAESDTWSDDTDVAISFFLERGSERYNISGEYGETCDLAGMDAWEIDGEYFCGTEVSNSVTEDAHYDLVAEWTLGAGDHRKVIDDDFLIDDEYIWTDIQTTHGGHIDDAVAADRGFDSDYTTEDGDFITTVGTTFQITDISLVKTVCVNGVTNEDNVPAVVGFIYDGDGHRIGTTNNEMFNDASCSIHDAVSRAELWQSEEGYLPQECSLSWTFGGETAFDVYTFEDPGEYFINMDYINAISDSPDYVCPGDSDAELCQEGAIDGDHHGWEALHGSSFKVVDPSGAAELSGYSSNVEERQGGDVIRRTDYDGDIRIDVGVENTGVGDIAVKDGDIDCPAGADCDVMTPLPLEVPEGKSADIRFNIGLDDGERIEDEASVSVTYADAYDLDDVDDQTFEHTVMIDEEPPTTTDDAPAEWEHDPVTVDLSCSDGGVGCDTTYYCTGDGCTDFEPVNPSITVSESGNNTVRYYSTDGAGNDEPVQETYVALDADPPEIACEDCAVPNPATLHDDIQFSPDVTDEHSGVDTVEICREETCHKPYCSYDADMADHCEYEVGHPYGIQEFCIQATDDANNTAKKCRADYHYDVTGGAGDPCHTDDVCIIGQCVEGTCQPTDMDPPSIVLH